VDKKLRRGQLEALVRALVLVNQVLVRIHIAEQPVQTYGQPTLDTMATGGWGGQVFQFHSIRHYDFAASLSRLRHPPNRFFWTKSAGAILASIERFCLQISNSGH
jgi:hypothetical protein